MNILNIKKIVGVFVMLSLTFMVFASAPKLAANTPSTPNNTKQEFRAAWASHLIGSMSAYTSEAQFKARATEILDILEYYNFNAIIMHLRTHNNAYYVSELSPKAAAFASVNFNTFDPMLWFIEETHKRGMEFHGWLNPYRLGTNYVGTMPTENPASNPANILSYNGASILNPGLPHVRDFVSDTIVEILERYPVDAIHFDDYFYINLGANGSTSGTNNILNEPDQQTFVTYGSGYNTSSASSKADWRRQQVNLMVESVSNTIKNFNQANNTHVQFGISPTGIYKNGNGVVTYNGNIPITSGSDTGGQTHYSSYLFADSVKWATEGWIDYLLPQSYWANSHPVASYNKIMTWWNDVFKYLDVNLYSGIGIYMADGTGNTYGWQTNNNEMKNQLEFIKGLENVQGSSLYSYNYVDSAYKGSSAKSATQMQNAKSTWSDIAVLPELKSMAQIIPGKVTNLKHLNGTLSFNKVADAKQYYVYRSKTSLNFTNAEIVEVIRSNDNIINYQTGDLDNEYTYAVRALSYSNTLGEAVTILNPANDTKLNVVEGASIRTALNETNQSLRFYAQFDEALGQTEQGFYIVEGDVSLTELKSRVNVETTNQFSINGQSVVKVPVSNVDNTGTFTTIIKNIKPTDFSKLYTVFGYYKKGGIITLSNNKTTRSVLEVAYKMTYDGKAEPHIKNYIDQIKLFGLDTFGQLKVTDKFETNHLELAKAFLNDWNTKFSLSLTQIDLESFYNSAVYGKVSSNNSLSGSRIYEFFKDQTLNLKWGWLLDYIESVDTKIWPSRQVVALKGNGTNPEYSNIYEGRHFITSLIGFFNGTYAYDGFPTNDFTNISMYDNLANFVDSILAKPNGYQYYDVGNEVKLPVQTDPDFSHYLINDQIYYEGDTLIIGDNLVIKLIFN